MQKHRSGMTLVELIVVIGIIAVLAGLAFPLFLSSTEDAKVRGTRALCQTALVAVTNYQTQDIFITVSGNRVHRFMWDLDGDNIIDGDPRHPDAPAALRQVAPDWYRGLGYTVGIDQRWLDNQGRVVDAWKNPLRIDYGNPEHGAHEIGLWSIGKDRTDQEGDPESDDLVSWRSPEP